MLAWKGGARQSAKQSKTEEGRRAAYFERRRRELAEAGADDIADHAAPQQQEQEYEESYDVLQLRFLVELAPAPSHEDAAAYHDAHYRLQGASAYGLALRATPEAPTQPASPGLRYLERADASDHGGSLNGHAERPLATAAPPNWHQLAWSPPHAAAYTTPPPQRKAAGALDLRLHQLASFSGGADESQAPYRLEPLVAMPVAPAAPAAAVHIEAAVASPERIESSWLVATAQAGAAAIAAGQGFRTPPRAVWAGSDDEAEDERLDATVALLLERGATTPLQDQAASPDFASFAAARRAALRPGDIMAHDGFQHGGGFFASDGHGSEHQHGEADAAVRMQRSYTQHTGGWPLMVTTEERLEVSYYQPHQHGGPVSAHDQMMGHCPVATSGCRITECDDEDDDGLGDLGMLLAPRARDGGSGDAARGYSFHVPAGLLGGGESPVPQRVEHGVAGDCVLQPAQLFSPASPQLSSPRSPRADDGGGGDAGAWAAAARFARQLSFGTDASASPKQAGAAPAAVERGDDQAADCVVEAAPAAPADVAAAPAEAPPAAARETRGVRQLRAALAVQHGEAAAEREARKAAQQYTEQLESAVLQLLLCKAAAEQSGDGGAAGSSWVCTPPLGDAHLTTAPAVARC